MAQTIELKLGDLKFNTFTYEELEDLQQFHEQFKKMMECKVITNKSLHTNISANRNADGLLETTIIAPDDDELGNLLLRIRPCILEGEPINFYRILKILGRRAADEESRSSLRAIHRNYGISINSTGIKIHIDGKEYGEKEVFDAYLNGEYFHVKDGEPRNIVENFKKAHHPHMARPLFVKCIINYLQWFELIDHIIELHVTCRL